MEFQSGFKDLNNTLGRFVHNHSFIHSQMYVVILKVKVRLSRQSPIFVAYVADNDIYCFSFSPYTCLYF